MTLLETIQEHHRLCDEIHQCVLDENRFLRQQQRAPDAALLEQKKTLLEKLDQTLVFRDFVSVCGSHLVFAKGRDRYTTRGKSIVYDGRDVSQDTKRSWVSPSCNGTTVVAAAGRSWWERRIGRGELRSIWELVPERKQLTHPPAGWTDEFPQVLADGSVLFVRTHQTIGDGTSTGIGQMVTGSCIVCSVAITSR